MVADFEYIPELRTERITGVFRENPVVSVGCDGVMPVIRHQSIHVLSEADGVSRL